MDMKKLFLLFALLCAVAQGALSQISYPILSNDVWDGKSQAMPQFYDRFEGKTAVVVINTCAELAYIASHWSETTGYAHPVYGKKCFNEINYLLNANLDMTRESWKPLGRGSISDTPFEGTLYGNCHTIFLRISNPDTNNQGLIAQIGSHGTVMDLHLAGSIDAGNSRKVGGITGLNYGTISGCWVSADVKSSYYSIIYDADLGGIAGWNYDGLIEYCCMTGNVVNTGGGSGVGGIAGSNDKDIQECAFYGTVTSKYNNDNKFVGDQNARCSNVTDIFEADIYRRGSGWPVFSFAYKYPYVMNISGSGPGAIEASAGGEKGILGWRPGETVTLTVTSGELASLAITDADGNEIAYENADGKQSYRFKMPNCIVNIKAKYFANWPTKGTGTANDPYILSSTEDWKELGHNIYCGRTYKGQYIKMTQDIAVSTMVGMNEVHSFQGTFIGDGHQLDVNISGSEGGMAPFHYIKDATIKDLRVTGKVTATANHASGLVGFADGTNLIERCTVGTWVYYEADWVGGVVGHGKRSKTTIRNCVFSGIIWHLFAQFTRGCAGVFWGWSESDATPILENCIESARNYMAISQFHPLGVNGGNGTVTDCYYVTPPDDGVPNPCPISGAVQVTTAAPADGIYRYARVNDLSVYSGACTVSGIGSDYDVEKGAVSITPVVTATTGAALALGTDYTATLNGNAVTSLPISISMAGNYELTLAGKGRYAGSASYKFTATAPTTGSGTADDPYLINSASDWNMLSVNVAKGQNYSGQYVKLTADIEITDVVGVYEGKPFSGTFLGEGHTLTANIRNTDSGKTGVAPFRYVKDATIRDVTVGGTIESNGRHATGLVGFADGTNLIEGCTVNATLNISTDYAGGIVGHGLASATTIRNCVFAGTFNNVGGNPTNIGAIWGWSDSGKPVLENCLEKGTYKNVSSMHPMGLQNGTGTITDCYYLTPQIGSPDRACTVSGACQVWPVPYNGFYKKITATDGKVYALPCTVGGVEARYYLADLSSITPVVTDASGTTLAHGTDYSATLNGTEVTAFPVTINTSGDYTLTITGKGAYGGSHSINFSVIAPLTGSGTADDPYLINSASDWNMLSVNVAKGQNYSGQYVKLTADIEITDVVGVYEGKPFSGTFLGEGHTLTANIRNTDSGKTGVAPFRYVKDATIRDVTVGGTIESNGRHATGLVGFADGTNLIEGCTVNATLNISTDYAGGIVGHGLASATTIRNCVFAGTFNNVGGNPTNIGAIWGWSDSGKPVLENCLEKGTYKNISSMHPMGLQNGTGTITNCYYLTPQIGSPDRACTVSGACQLSATNTGDGIYRQITLTDGTYYIVCYFSGVERRYLYTGSDITVAPTVTAADGTKLTAGTDFTYTPETVREMGDYTLTISGKGSYTGTKTFPISVSDQREVTSKSTVLTTGEYTVFEDVTIAERITIDGSVVLNLGENAKLKVPKGIELSKGNSLTINGPGSLNIGVVETDKSGIGAVEVGTLVINSGSIEISVFSAGAAIGGDRNNTSGGSITINGGKISIVNTRGKCIGGGYDDDRKGQYGVCGDIVINGGQLDLGSIIGFFGPSIHSNDVKYNSGTLTLGWTNPDDYIRTVNILGSASDLSLERISFVEGRPFVLDGTTTVATADNIVGTKLVPLLALADNRDNSETLSRYAGAQLPVQLDGRTLYRDGSWNTLCLPFSVKLSGSPLEGATARPLTSASISGTTLNLSFGSAVTELVAGTPYIIKWAGGEPIVSPVFSPVSIDKTDRSYDNGAAGDARVRFIGTYNSLTFDSDDKSILFMGGASKLHYPAKGASIGAQRAYFKIGEDGAASNARIASFNIDFGEGEATGIQEIVNSKSVNSQSDGWYTLDGRQLDGKPTQSGVYINGGRKVVIK